MKILRDKNPRILTNSGKSKVIYNKSVLGNGIRIVTEEVPSAETFALGIHIDAGSRDDFAGMEGIAHFLEHSVFLRTKNRSSKQISVAFESLGAYANAYTTKENTCFYVRALKSHFRKSFGILSDVALNPKLVEKEFEKEKLVILEEIKSYEDDPEELIFDYIEKILFEGHSLSHPIAGFQDSVSNISIDDIYRFHGRNYSPGKIVITAAGAIKHDSVVAETEKYFAGLGKRENIDARVIYKDNKLGHFEGEKPFTQCHITLGRIVPGMLSQERYPLALLNVILGDGMSSRLYHQLRERYGFAYAAYSSLQLMSDIGTIYVYSTAERKNIKKVKRVINEEFSKLAEGKISETEIKRAREQVKSSTIMALESMNTRMSNLAKSELTLGEYEDIRSTIEAVESVTLQDLKETASRYLDYNEWSSVVFLDE